MAAFGDEMSEGSARITREIQHKVRTPLLAPRSHSSVSGSVPLEFDEEDGNFLGGGVGALFDVPVPLPQQREGSSASPGTSRYDGVSVDSSLSASSASVNIYDDVVMRTSGRGGITKTRWRSKRRNVLMISLRWVFWMQDRKRRSPLLLRVVRVGSRKGGSIDR
jgi:hypothetical protein